MPTLQACRTTSRRRTSGRAGPVARCVAHSGRVLPEVGGEAHLAQGVAVGGDDPVAEGAVGGEARGGEEGAGRLVVGEQPQRDRLGTGLGEQVDARVEQARAVALAAGVGVHAEHGHLTGGGPASGSCDGPIAASPTTWSPAQATSRRCTPSGGAAGSRASRGRRRRARRGPRRRRAADRRTPRGTRSPAPCPTAGASLGRARRTLASASGPGSRAWSCGWSWSCRGRGGRPRQCPRKAGVRRSAKARRPSARSSLAQARAKAAS